MAYKLIWSPVSRDDLRDIVRFIARDSPQRAESFAYRLMAQTDKLQDHPEIGEAFPSIAARQFARSYFGLVESSIAWITHGGLLKLRASGTPHEVFRMSASVPLSV